MGTEDFYEAQSRLDGAFCQITEDQKFAFLNEDGSFGHFWFRQKLENIFWSCTGISLHLESHSCLNFCW